MAKHKIILIDSSLPDLMKILIQPLYSQLNPGLGCCPLGCKTVCKVREKAPTFDPPVGATCPLSLHQAKTYVAITQGDADVIINKGVTGDGKSLALSLPVLLDSGFRRMMALYPTIELVEDQTRSQREYHTKFGLDADKRIDRIYGEELTRRVMNAEKSNRFQELRQSIKRKRVILTNPDIFHLINNYRYQDPAYDRQTLATELADFPDLYAADEFHIFAPHQEASMLHSMELIRCSRDSSRPFKFLFTSATPKPEFLSRLKDAGFKVAEIEGAYSNQAQSGYRQISQGIELTFVHLKDTDTLAWLTDQANEIKAMLTAESAGRGLIILNSVAQAGKVAALLKKLLPEVEIQEVSGRIDRKEREQNRQNLQNSDRPILVIGTSAVDVGVDFKIHLLIFEGSDSATVIQRLGRLGRHPGFSQYKAFLLVPGRTPWVMAQINESLGEATTVERAFLMDALRDAFDEPKNFQEYHQRWAAIQAEGLLWQMGAGYKKYDPALAVIKPLRDRMGASLDKVYHNTRHRFSPHLHHWTNLTKDKPLAKAIQSELLRFRGGSAMQAAVWDGQRFYTYDLFRILPHTLVDVVDREQFLQAAQQKGYDEFSFPEDHIQVYLKVQEWVKERSELELSCGYDSGSDSIKCFDLILLDRLRLEHPQATVKSCLSRRKFLVYLVPLGKRQSQWDVVQALRLNPTFGIYRLTDAANQNYACAFNQDALLLESMKNRIFKHFGKNQTKFSIF
jgi:CRISPR-associated endonuclease/helicase Cas3